MSHGNQNSSCKLKKLEGLVLKLGNDCGLTEKDLETVSRRIQREGLPFLTVSLPALSKALCAGVSTGTFLLPSGFKPCKPESALPAFLGGLFSKIFSFTGEYLDSDGDVAAFRSIYQFCGFVYKMVMPYSEDQIGAFADSFIQTDADLADLEFSPFDPILVRAAAIVSEVFSDFDPDELVCKDGPGAVANSPVHLKGTMRLTAYPSTTSRYLPHFFLNFTAMCAEKHRWPIGDLIDPVAKVIFVPKDSRGPRVISAEPRENQFIQQGIRRYMYQAIERHPLTRGCVNFEKQSFNGDAALSSSLLRDLATIDLKEASDRVSLALFKRLFAGVPLLRKYVLDSRSTHASLPDGRVVSLNKFAPMGSALCFPVMSLVIFSLIRAAHEIHDRDFPRDNNLNHQKMLLVYGDDIVVGKNNAWLAMDVLSSYGLKVNTEKSYVGGPFAESCGCDAYKGVDVTPVRLRTSLDALTGHVKFPNGKAKYLDFHEDALSLVETVNQLDSKGYCLSANFLAEQIEDSFGHLPFGYEHSGVPCFRKEGGYHRAISPKEVRKPRYWTIKSITKANQDESGWTHLLRTVHSLGSDAKAPEFGVYDMPRQYVVVRCTKPRDFDFAYPASTWLPYGTKKRDVMADLRSLETPFDLSDDRENGGT